MSLRDNNCIGIKRGKNRSASVLNGCTPVRVLILALAFFIIKIAVKAVVCPLKMGKGMEY